MTTLITYLTTSIRIFVQECELCEDPSLSRTGVCIGCDAGMCKTFFHASWYVALSASGALQYLPGLHY
jgi:hypothetical protein